MPSLSPTAALLLLLHSSAPGAAQRVTPPWDISGAPRFTVTADGAGDAQEVPISSNRTLSFLFNMPVQSGGAVVEERERFRQVSLSEDGLMLTLLPSDELEPGRRLRLTVRFADGATPTSTDFTLVVSPQAEAQVEVYREVRPCDSYRQQAEEAEARVQQCQTQLARERAERDAPRSLTGLLALKQMNEEGIRSKILTKDVTLRPGAAFIGVELAVSYRATGGEVGVPVTRLAVDLALWNDGPPPWTPTHAQLVGEGVRWDLEVWSQFMAPGKSLRVLVEVERPGRAASGPYLLKLWDQSGTRTVTIAGVTFP